MSEKFCFCTLAVGNRYRTHARMLANDIQQHSPATSFIVLTDQPTDFEEYAHVIAVKHRLQSVQGYHDKRCVLEKALTLFDTCVYLDSDMRILGAVPEGMEWLPGITARTGCNILQHNSSSSQRRALPVINQVATKLDINLQETLWFHEFMFAVKKQDGAEVEFFKFWQKISYFFEKQGIYGAEGNVMGLAATLSGLNVRFDSEDRFPFFKDNIEKIRIKKGQSNLEEKQIYFDIHKNIEYPKRSILKKAIDKLIKKIVFLYRLFRLRTVQKQNLDF